MWCNKCIVFAVNKLLIKSCRETGTSGGFEVLGVGRKWVVSPLFNEVQTR
jgi:hypothetical protein